MHAGVHTRSIPTGSSVHTGASEPAVMNTTKNTHRLGTASAILLGFALAVAPASALASQTGATPVIVPTGPDIVLAATENLRQLIEADRAPEVPPRPAAKTLRQLMEEDRAPEVAPVPARPADKTLRQLMEEDRAPEVASVPARPPDKTLRQLMEEDRK